PMPGPVAAIAGAAVVGAGASLIGSRSASKSADKAAKEQTKATQAAIASEQKALERQIGLQEPFRQVGINALAKYPAAAEPTYTPFGMDQFNADPGYQFRMSEGLKALERSAASRGILSSGQTLKDITRFGQDTASQEYQNAFSRYMAETQRMREEKMAPLEYQIGLGQAAASGQAANIGTTAGSTSNLLQGLGNINAQRAVTQGNIMSGMAGSICNIAGQAAQGYADYSAAQPYQIYLRSITPQGFY
ncbi:MAG: hypothetical protein ABFD94_01825, partial [Armatimonadia bacterium]